jgi:hypothetical protein
VQPGRPRFQQDISKSYLKKKYMSISTLFNTKNMPVEKELLLELLIWVKHSCFIKFGCWY